MQGVALLKAQPASFLNLGQLRLPGRHPALGWRSTAKRPRATATTPEKPDLKRQFRAMVRGAQSLTVADIGVVNGLFAALKQLGAGDAAA